MLALLNIIGYCCTAENLCFRIRTVRKGAIDLPIPMSIFSCETGDSLTVLSQLGHLCFVVFFQTTHSGNLFAAFVALLQKRHETSASQSRKKTAGQPLRIDSVWTEMHESEWEFGQKDNSYRRSAISR